MQRMGFNGTPWVTNPYGFWVGFGFGVETLDLFAGFGDV